MKYTPGPWTAISVGFEAGRKADILDDKGRCVATTNPDWHVLHRTYAHPDECEANARLIAAAPELLIALKRTLSWLTSYPGGGAMGAYEQARAAIAKAEGQ